MGALRSAGATEWVLQPLCDALPPTFEQFVSAVAAGDNDPEHLQMAVAVTRVPEAAYCSAAFGQAQVVFA